MARGKRRFQVDALVLASMLRLECELDLVPMHWIYSELESRTNEYIDKDQVRTSVGRLIRGGLVDLGGVMISDEEFQGYAITSLGREHFERFELDVRALLDGYDSLVGGRRTGDQGRSP